jgi:hypothetical protein
MKPFYKTFFLLFLNVSFLGINSFGQVAPGIEWQNTIGGNEEDYLTSINRTNDGGFIVGGGSQSGISGDKSENCWGYNDYWIVKLNAAGNIQWQNTIGGTSVDNFSSIRQSSDGGYFLGGNSNSNISGDKTENSIGSFDFWIVKLNASGNIQWQNDIGGSLAETLFELNPTIDGGCILGGQSSSGISGDKSENCIGGFDYWVVKLDSLGTIQWQNTIGGAGYDLLISIQQTNDSGYILGGFSDSNISGDKTENSMGDDDYWVIKLGPVGNIEWQNTIGGNNQDDLYSIQQTTDGGYILGGKSISDSSGDKTENSCGQFDYWVVKLDTIGNIQWQNTIGGSGEDVLNSIKQCSDGGYIAGGFSYSGISGDKTENSQGMQDYWVVRLNPLGNIVWQKTIGGSDEDWLKELDQTTDGGYILGGWSTSNISGDKTENSSGLSDYWIVKLFPDTTTSIPTLQSSINNLQISPNPSSGMFQITFPSSSSEKTTYTLEVISTLGQTVYTSPPAPLQRRGENSTELDLSSLPKGMYLLKAITPEKILSKIIIIH